jgi:hypothetical protein
MLTANDEQSKIFHLLKHNNVTLGYLSLMLKSWNLLKCYCTYSLKILKKI